MRWSLALALMMVGCSGGSDEGCGDNSCSGPENFLSCPSDCSLPSEYEGGNLEECVEGETPQAEIDDDIMVLIDVEESYHEMIACGGLIVKLAKGIFELIVNLAQDLESMKVPAGYTYNKDGSYTTQPDDVTTMRVTFHYGPGLQSGVEGEQIEHNLFDLDNYLVNPRLDFNANTQKILIRFDGTGPLVELLGFGAAPTSPIKIGVGATPRGELKRVRIASEIDVKDHKGDTNIDYTVAQPLKAVSALLENAVFGYDAVSATASRFDQDFDSTNWDIDYVDDTNALDGRIDFDVVGGNHDLIGWFDYKKSPRADVVLQCP